MRTGRTALIPLLLLACSPLVTRGASAQITRIDIEVVESPALDGRSFGAVGQYERLRGTFYGEADPDHPLHAGIVNLDLAPRNNRGRVEYSTTVEIYRPVDLSRWNGAIYHTVPNRGGAGSGPDDLLERGFTLVRVGWQGDITPSERNIVPQLPVAVNPDGSSVVGPAYEEFIFNDDDTRQYYEKSTATLNYPAASLDPSHATLTVRQRQDDPRSAPLDMTWRFDGDSRIVIGRPAGFDGGAIYEFVYEARDPIVMGLGFAAMRDAISFLRYDRSDAQGNANPLAPGGTLPRVAMSIGISQSGRYLRDMLYQGFNEDLEGRIVFDGMHPDIAGSRKTFTNFAFSQPGRWQKQHEDHLFPGDQFPFTYGVLTDPISGRTDGLLARCSVSDTCPNVIQTDGETEIWQARASLVVTDPLGRDITLPDDVRYYVLSGTEHGGGRGVFQESPGTGMCRFLGNPMAISQIRTALTVALYEWVAEGRLPPPSRYPTAAGGGFVRAEDVSFPEIPGVEYTRSFNDLRLHDFRTLPPTGGPEYTVLVGQVDADGNMTGGLLHPHLAVPVGTYTGWNLRREGFAPDEQCGGSGSSFSFAETEAERLARGDPRPSLEERYASTEVYLTELQTAASQLVLDRLLLPEDALEIVRTATFSLRESWPSPRPGSSWGTPSGRPTLNP